MKRPNRSHFAIALAFATLPFAPGTRAAEDPALDRPEGWVLKSMTASGVASAAIEGKGEVTLHVKGRKLHGSAGVNSYSGSVRVTARGGFRIGRIDFTEMAGDPAMMKQEMRFLDVLGKVSSYKIADGELLLSDDDGDNRLAFAPKVPAKPAELVGTKWRLAGFEESDGESVAFTQVLDEAVPTLSFNKDGNFSGSGGVNRLSGSYKADPDSGKIEIGMLLSTHMAGPPDLMKQEHRYTKALAAAAQFRINGDRLAISDQAGDARLLFEAIK